MRFFLCEWKTMKLSTDISFFRRNKNGVSSLTSFELKDSSLLLRNLNKLSRNSQIKLYCLRYTFAYKPNRIIGCVHNQWFYCRKICKKILLKIGRNFELLNVSLNVSRFYQNSSLFGPIELFVNIEGKFSK